jgi:hypothetical protein
VGVPVIVVVFPLGGLIVKPGGSDPEVTDHAHVTVFAGLTDKLAE